MVPNGTGDEQDATAALEAAEGEVVDAPRRSKDSWLKSPGDLVELDIEIPSVGDSVKIRSLSAGQHAQIQNESMTMKGDTMRFDTHRRNILTFTMGVVEPKFSENEANVIAHKFGPAFKLVVDAIGEISESSEEAMKRVRERFRARR